MQIWHPPRNVWEDALQGDVADEDEAVNFLPISRIPHQTGVLISNFQESNSVQTIAVRLVAYGLLQAGIPDYVEVSPSVTVQAVQQELESFGILAHVMIIDDGSAAFCVSLDDS